MKRGCSASSIDSPQTNRKTGQLRRSALDLWRLQRHKVPIEKGRRSAMTLKEFFTQFFHLVERPDAEHALPQPGVTANSWVRDEFGNHYYRTRGGARDPALGYERRWVIYSGLARSVAPCRRAGAAGSPIPTPPPPRRKNTPRANGRKLGAENHTGTAQAYRPQGSISHPRGASESHGRFTPPGRRAI